MTPPTSRRSQLMTRLGPSSGRMASIWLRNRCMSRPRPTRLWRPDANFARIGRLDQAPAFPAAAQQMMTPEEEYDFYAKPENQQPQGFAAVPEPNLRPPGRVAGPRAARRPSGAAATPPPAV